ncbi:CHASE2 domain-containing protein [Chlorogloea sp. CCALA 695]|uniref:CHASE2 domain-containing protein n=1 Tax=Chlorogloea sp. CCALA 695 TaxID=2107693 RepID=UPI000D06E5D0|nr:CHASE2 domain-containing protein [Chlorogloea sp. CCALA 695]PSB32081.1 serine/threonine protein kinase [Chlorogloea sp. CCALA 695]
MSHCINPRCQIRQNPDNLEKCSFCGTSLLINGRYLLVKPLRELSGVHTTEIFEVDDRSTRKVLKVLNSDRSKLIELLQQEAKVLQKLQNLGVPKVYEYFTFLPNNESKKLHCLVMEKIEGQNLKQWLEENEPISEARAINWLKQITSILSEVHQAQLLHRDIKPSNIMLRPDGQLVLIDFGTVREITHTYVHKLGQSDITQVYSPGYTPLEQMEGQAVKESDFFALGRTFIHLLTGIYPAELPKNPQTNQLIWRNQASQISEWLVYLIDELLAPLPQNRPQNAQSILECLVKGNIYDETRLPLATKQITTTINQTTRTQQRQSSIRQIWRTGLRMLLTSIVVTSVVVGVRQQGALETWELAASDSLQRLRPLEGADPRLLVVTITEADIQAQFPRQGSLSDRTLEQLLMVLEQYQPRAIGLDIYRDVPVGVAYPNLTKYLQKSDNFIGLCKISDPSTNNPGIAPPPELSPEFIGFSDIMSDEDTTVRRQLLHLTPPSTSPCTTEYAFSLQLALYYLATEGIVPKVTPQGNLQFGEVVFSRLNANNSGAYKNADLRGYQVLLNYRPYRAVTDITFQVSLDDILKNRLTPATKKQLQDRIVLIGVTAPTSVNDYWFTPYSSNQRRFEKQSPGVFIQAQMVSHILSAVLDQRPVLSVWNLWLENLWVAFWSIVGGLLAWYFKQILYLGLAASVTLFILGSTCFGLLLQGSLVPLVPPALSLLFTSIIIVIYRNYKSK